MIPITIIVKTMGLTPIVRLSHRTDVYGCAPYEILALVRIEKGCLFCIPTWCYYAPQVGTWVWEDQPIDFVVRGIGERIGLSEGIIQSLISQFQDYPGMSIPTLMRGIETVEGPVMRHEDCADLYTSVWGKGQIRFRLRHDGGITIEKEHEYLGKGPGDLRALKTAFAEALVVARAAGLKQLFCRPADGDGREHTRERVYRYAGFSWQGDYMVMDI